MPFFKKRISLVLILTIISFFHGYSQVKKHAVLSTQSNQVLPVAMLSMSVQNDEPNKIILKWETATEVNNDHFKILVSVEGKTFVQYATVQGHGNKNTPTAYKLAIDVKSKILTGSMFLSFLLISCLRNRRLQLIVLGIFVLAIISCAKDKQVVDGKIHYIQLEQVDTNGKVTVLGVKATKPKITT